MPSFGDLPFPAAVGLLSALAVVGVAGLVAVGAGPLALAFLLIPGALAALYLHGYAARPGPETSSEPGDGPGTSGDGVGPDEDDGDDWDPLVDRPAAGDDADAADYSATR